MAESELRQMQAYRQMELDSRAAGGEAHSPDQVRQQVEEARKQAEYFENQSRKLELSNEQKSKFNADLNDIGMRVHNAVQRLGRELESMKREQRELEIARNCLQEHLHVLSTLQPQSWGTNDVAQMLREALPKLDWAENDFNEVYAAAATFRHTDVLRHKPGEEHREGLTWCVLKEQMAKGLFFHLPLFLLLLATWLIYMLAA